MPLNPSSFLSSLPGKKTLILTHAGADVDAFCAAASLFAAFRGHADLVIGVPDHINQAAKALAQNLDLAFILSPKEIDSFDRIIVVDCNSFDMLGSLADALRAFGKPILVIDHHQDGKERISKKPLRLIDPKCVSTCELVYRLLAKKRRRHLTPFVATLIAAGIIVDSAHFTVASPETFSIMSRCLERSGKALPEIVSQLRVSKDISEKIAMLKAARRTRIYRSGSFILASTQVGSFEASCASALLRLGADVAFAGSDDKGKLVISARANNHLVVKTGFDLAEHAFRPAEKEFGGFAGGHPAAAGYNVKGADLETVLKRCIDATHAYFRQKSGGVSQLQEFE